MQASDKLVMSQPFADLIIVSSIIEKIEENSVNKKYLQGQAAYHLQQAAEKLIKIQMYNSGKPIRNDKVYKHSLSELIDYAESIGISLNIPSYIRKNAEIITSWEAEGRYDVHVVVRLDRIKNTYEAIDQWYLELKECGYK